VRAGAEVDEEERVVWLLLVVRAGGEVVEEDRVLLVDVLLVEVAKVLGVLWLVLLVLVEDVVRLEDVLELELELRAT